MTSLDEAVLPRELQMLKAFCPFFLLLPRKCLPSTSNGQSFRIPLPILISIHLSRNRWMEEI